jgi:nucleoside-diphosphate-sugar epimerase
VCPLSEKVNVITGATGLIGSHIAEILAARGERTRALVRPESDTSFLRSLGTELVFGTLQQPEILRQAFAGASIVYHCAARVGDWGPWRLFQEEIIDATRNVLEACKATGVGRIVYTSSITVYGRPRNSGLIGEDEERGQRMRFRDHYCRSKIMAEDLAWDYGPKATIIRPGWTYGPRDRNTLPRIIKALKVGRITMIGDGSNLLNLVYAGDVAEGAILAANNPQAGGQAYNLCSEGELTQKQFLKAVTDGIGLPPVHRRLPFWLAYSGGFMSEVIAKVIRLKRAPYVTRYAVALVGRPTRFSIDKARQQLGWSPRVRAEDGIRRTLEWIQGTECKANREEMAECVVRQPA